MPLKWLFAVIMLLGVTHMDWANNYIYDYTDNCRKAYLAYTSLRIEEAGAALKAEQKENPDNLMATYISDYEDCILLLLNCDEAEYKRRAKNEDIHIKMMEKGDASSPWYRFCKGGVYLHWAIINLRFGEQYSAALNFRWSFALLKENQRLFPDFAYNNTFAGLQEAVIGSLPGNFKWLASIFGMKGNIRKGTEKLSSFIATHTANDLMYNECILYYLYTRFYLLQEQKEVWSYLASEKFPTENNLLNAFVKANLAIDYRKSDEAIKVLRAAMGDKNSVRYPIFSYQMGVALLTKEDTTCTKYFQDYLRRNNSDLYIKDTWQKMAFAWYVAGNMSKATYCHEQIRTRGTTRIDADKQAEKFGESGVWPNVKLLQARLRIEGGYYNAALQGLNNIQAGSLKDADKAEYFYRYGKVYEEQENYPAALDNYKYAIMAGRNRHEQFAARAALQMGKIYEHTGKPSQATDSYHECLDMPEHDFQNSIDQQAKAGINRIERK